MAGKSTTMTFKLFGSDVSASKTLKSVGKTAAGVASGMGVALAASKVSEWAKDSMTAFSDVGKSSLTLQRYIGGSVEDASRLGHAFRMSGVDIDTAGKGITILSKHLAAGDKAALSLGISFKDSTGKVKPMAEMLPQIAEKFKTMPAGAEKTALAVSLFGKAGAKDMLPFLNKGADGIKELMKQSDALGTTMSGKDGQAVKDYTKTQREFKEMILGVQISLGRALYPTLTKLGTELLPMLLPKVQEFTKQMGKLPELIEQKWPMIHDKIKEVFDELSKVEQQVRSNWPAIKDTFQRVGDALARVGQWTQLLWDKFQSLPGPVKELIAMLAIAQKTGVLSIAFKGLDLAKTLFMKLTGMNVQAGVVNVNGAGGGVPGKAGKGAGIAGAAATVGGVALSAAAWTAVAVALGYAFDRWLKPGEKRKETGGNTNTAGGTYGAIGGGGDGWPSPGTDTQQNVRKYIKLVEDSNRGIDAQRQSLKGLVGAYQAQIDSVKRSGASVERVTAAQNIQRDSLRELAGKLGLSKEETDALVRSYDTIPANKTTTVKANTDTVKDSITAVADQIRNFHPAPIGIGVDTRLARGSIAGVGSAVGAILNPPPIKLKAKSEVHGPVAEVGRSIGELLFPPPIKITAKSEVHGPVAEVGRDIGQLLNPPPILFSADPSGAVAAINTILHGLALVRNSADMAGIGWGFNIRPTVRAYAKGGIFSSPTLGIIGEAGPEAVIPLTAGGRSMLNGGGTTEIHVHVSGSVFATKDQMAREVVAALQNAKNRGLQLNLAG